jgi:hypothetical protein
MLDGLARILDLPTRRPASPEWSDEKVEVIGNPIMGRRDDRPRLSGSAWQFRRD